MSDNIDFQALSKNQFDAAVALTGAVAKKIGKIVIEAQDFSTSSLQSNADLIQKLASVKNIDDLIVVQTNHAKAAYDASLAWSKKFGDLFTDLTTTALVAVPNKAENFNVAVKAPLAEKALQAAE